jgi:hypothetical protein
MKDWLSQLDQLTEQFVTAFGALTSAQLNWKPAPQTWSIAQNIHHLIVVNESYYPILASLRSGTYKTPFIGKVGFMVSLFGKVILNSVKPDRKKKTKTFAIWEPTAITSEDILQQFEKHQSELKQQIAACEKLTGKGAVISSPVNKNIVYKLETAFDIIVSHEQRHLEQAKEVLQQLAKASQ